MAKHEHPVSCIPTSLDPELVEKDENGSLFISHKGPRLKMEAMKRAIERAWPCRYTLETRPSDDDPEVWELSLTHR